MHLIGSRDGARFGAKVDVLKNIPTFEWLGKKAKNYDISGVYSFFFVFFLPSTIYLPSLDEFPTSCQCVLERLLIRLILASTWQPTRIENHQTWFKSSEGPSARGKGGGGRRGIRASLSQILKSVGNTKIWRTK